MRELVVLVADREPDRTRDLLLELSRTGLLKPFVWVADNETAEVVEGGKATPIHLDRYLAAERLTSLRLVSLAVLVNGRVHASFDSVEISRRLRSRCRAALIDFRALQLVVGEDDAVVDPALFQPTWEANVCIVPEDSAGSRGMTAVVLDATGAESVAANSVATIGGLWTWMERGPLDEDEVLFIEGQRLVRLARLTVRVIDAGDLASRVIEWALDARGVWPVPAGSQAHGMPVAAIDELVPHIVGAPEIEMRFRPPPSFQRSTPVKTGLWAALTLFFGRLWRHIRGLPSRKWTELKESTVRRVEGAVQARTFGSGSEIQVSIVDRPTVADDLVESTRRLARMTTSTTMPMPAPTPTSAAWRRIRSVVFGLVDGGDFDGSLHGHEPSWHGTRAVILDKNLVAPPLSAAGLTAFELTTDDLASLGLVDETDEPRYIGGIDVTSIRMLKSMLDGGVGAVESVDDAVAEPSGDQSADVDRPVSAESEPEPQPGDVRDSQAVVAAEHGTAASASEVTAPIDDEPIDSDGVLESITVPLADRLDEWVRERDRSLLWKVGSSIADGIDHALKALTDAREGLEKVRAGLEAIEAEHEKLRRRSRRRALLIVALLILMLAGAVTGFILVSTVAGLVLCGLMVAAVIAVPFTFLKIAREHTRLEFRLRDLERLPDYWREVERHAFAELARLTCLNEQFVDWVEVYASLIHAPWGQQPVEGAATPWEGPSEIYSLAAGRANIDPDEIQGEVLRLRRDVARRGWLTALYLSLEERWTTRYCVIAAVPDGLGSEPESDVTTSRDPLNEIPATGEAVFSPRVQLRLDVTTGRFADALKAEQVSSLRERMSSRRSEALVHHIGSDLPGLESTEPSDFLGSVAEFSPLPGFVDFVRPQIPPLPTDVDRSILGVSQSIEFEEPHDEVRRERVELSGVGGRFTLASFRLDLSKPINAHDLSRASVDLAVGGLSISVDGSDGAEIKVIEVID